MLAEKMLAWTPKLRAAKTEAEKATLQNAVSKTDHDIGALVYELYALTPDEIALVEKGRLAHHKASQGAGSTGHGAAPHFAACPAFQIRQGGKGGAAAGVPRMARRAAHGARTGHAALAGGDRGNRGAGSGTVSGDEPAAGLRGTAGGQGALPLPAAPAISQGAEPSRQPWPRQSLRLYAPLDVQLA